MYNHLTARLAIVISLLYFIPVQAAESQTETETDTIVAQRTETISKSLRCVVCQNESIHDSNAPLAQDMRRLVEERVRAGDSDKAVRAWMRRRYGDYILMNPPLQTNTIILWAGPFILLFMMLAGFTLWQRSRMKRPGS